MFRRLGDFIHTTPWWAMILLGVSVLLLLIAFSVPTHVFRLSETGATPEERRAIKREIDRAVGDSALGMAENVVRAIMARTNDPARRVEMERALEQIAEARSEIYAAQKLAADAPHDASDEAQRSAMAAAQSAQRAAIEAALDAASANLEAATEARVAVEEAKQEAADKLKGTGADASVALKAFDEMIRAAKDKERQAREELRRLKDSKRRGFSVRPDPSAPLVSGGKPDGKTPGPAGKDEGAVKLEGAAGGRRLTGKIDLSDKGGRLDVDLQDAAPAPSKTSPAAPAAPPGAPAPPAPPALTINGERIALNLPTPATVLLPSELRETIKSSVRQDVRRIAVGSVLVLIFIPLFIMTLIAKYFIDRARRAAAFAEQKKKEAEQSNVNRQIVEARLQALQAQVEPHFLYNTLANVQALTEVDPNQANQMTGHLINYLRNALPKMRESTSTVGQELELVRAYLNILRMRMGARLEFAIDCADDLLATPFPPLMLPSLVENAIKHGLEPQKEGGRVDVIVTSIPAATGKRVRIEVRDTGRGLTASSATAGTGVGLSNIRERLIALYGEGGTAGRLTLESNQPKGVVATLEVPADMPRATPGTADAPAKPVPPKGWWGKTRHAIAASHGVWAKIMSKTFIALMVALAIVFGLALAALYAGLMPLNIADVELSGLEGMALGTLLLLVGFGVVALVLLVVVGLLYGLGLLFAGLLIIIPLIILISVFPAVAPFVLMGALGYWWFAKRKKASAPDGGA